MNHNGRKGLGVKVGSESSHGYCQGGKRRCVQKSTDSSPRKEVERTRGENSPVRWGPNKDFCDVKILHKRFGDYPHWAGKPNSSVRADVVEIEKGKRGQGKVSPNSTLWVPRHKDKNQ